MKKDRNRYGGIRCGWVNLPTERQSQNEPHEPKEHEAGWSMAIETPNGVVGLWSCWLRNRFYLGYPKKTAYFIDTLRPRNVREVATSYVKDHGDRMLTPPKLPISLSDARDILMAQDEVYLRTLMDDHNIPIPPFEDVADIPEHIIARTLGVRPAETIEQVDAIAYATLDEAKAKTDHGTEAFVNAHRQHIGFTSRGPRRWAEYWEPHRDEDAIGRVHINIDGLESNPHPFTLLQDDRPDGHARMYYGHFRSRHVSTYPFTHANVYMPDGPTTKPDRIMPYRGRFLELACLIANHLGGAIAVHIDYNFVLVPEQLEQIGCTDIQWLKGRPGARAGWGEDIVRAKRGDETILLVSANRLVPWRTIRRVPIESDTPLTREHLESLLVF